MTKVITEMDTVVGLADKGKLHGLYKSSDEIYFGGPGMSKSSLDQVNISMKYYLYRLENPTGPTPAMIFGSAAHCFILEYHLFFERYIIETKKFDKRTNIGKAAYKEFVDECDGKIVLTLGDYDKIRGMSDHLKSESVFNDLMDGSEYEVTAYNTVNGQVRRSKADIVNRGLKTLIDFKTTEDASIDGFSKSIYNWRYDVQAAYYLDNFNEALNAPHGASVFETFTFIATEKNPPYDFRIFTASDEMVMSGRNKYQDNLKTYNEAMESKVYPGYSKEILEIELPYWARNYQ